MAKAEKPLIIKSRPSSYPMTEPQKMMREVLQECGIKKGITRAEMVDKMVNCIPQTWRRKLQEKEQKEKGTEEQPPS